jgi:hypothetical protein
VKIFTGWQDNRVILLQYVNGYGITKGEAIYTIGTIKQTPAGHAGLILPPLFLTLIFCFGLMLVQQHQASSRATAKAAYEKAHTKLSPSSLPTITPLEPVTVTPPAASGSGTPPPVQTSAPPQPSRTSGAAVQGAAPGSQQHVIYEVSKPVNKLLTNLLH